VRCTNTEHIQQILFSSSEMKAQMSFFDYPLSVSLLKVYINDFFYRNNGPILTRFGTNHPWGSGLKILQWKGNTTIQEETSVKRKKNTENFQKPISSRLISIKLGANYPWVKKIQNSPNKGLYKDEIITKMQKKYMGSFRNLLKNQVQEKLRFTWKLP
jgi:hypothetical protein